MHFSFKMYFYSLCALALGLIGVSLTQLHGVQIDIPLLAIILCTAIVSECLNSTYQGDVQLAFSGPVTIFAVIEFPVAVVYGMIIAYTLVGRIYAMRINHEYSRVFDIKLIYNMCQYIILSTIVYAFYRVMGAEMAYSPLLVMICSALYMVTNMLMMSFTLTLFMGENKLPTFLKSDVFYFIYNSILVSMLIVVGYSNFGITAIIFTIAFIAPLQRKMLKESQYHNLALRMITDGLTGAYNRYYFEEMVGDLIKGQKAFTMLFIDFDNFKRINDSYGHTAGDLVLRHFVTIMEDLICGEGEIFRYGGDEFCIVIQDRDMMHGILEEINQLSERSCVIFEGRPISYRFSYGRYSWTPDNAISLEEIIKILDRNMYNNKSHRRFDQFA